MYYVCMHMCVVELQYNVCCMRNFLCRLCLRFLFASLRMPFRRPCLRSLRRAVVRKNVDHERTMLVMIEAKLDTLYCVDGAVISRCHVDSCGCPLCFLTVCIR